MDLAILFDANAIRVAGRQTGECGAMEPAAPSVSKIGALAQVEAHLRGLI